MYLWASLGIVSFVVTISILVITSLALIHSGTFYFIAVGINRLDFLIVFLGVILGCIGLMQILSGMRKRK